MLFPLGLTKHKTPAASPLPGHLLAMTGMAGHWAAVGLLVAAGLGFATSLIVRPPANLRAAAWRLALGLTVMFTLAPATRWGYFVYPIGLVGWMFLSRPPPPAPRKTAGQVRAAQVRAAPCPSGCPPRPEARPEPGKPEKSSQEPMRQDSR